MTFSITPSLGGYVLRTETEWFLCETKAEALALAQRERERIARESAEIEREVAE